MKNSNFYVGAVFPQTEIGDDPFALRDYAQAIEDMGYSHIVAYDHIVGVHPSSRPDEWRPYNHQSQFHEPLTLFSFWSGLTTRIGFMSGVIILPQRQTVLFAKQAANIDVYSNGRLRLGLGLGYIAHEYEALGMDFKTRGKRFDDQVRLLRRLWTEEVITDHGPDYKIEDSGIAPLPRQRPIPIFIGGLSLPARKRAAAIGDGYFSMGPMVATAPMIDEFEDLLRQMGRDRANVLIDHNIMLGNTMGGPVRNPRDCAAEIAFWRQRGLNGVAVHTMGMGLTGPDAHIQMMRAIAEEYGLSKSSPSGW